MAPIYIGDTAIQKVYKGSTEVSQAYLGTSTLLSTAPTGTDHFGILTYSGDNSNPRSITGLDFDPGMVWVKNRHSGGENHGMGDILRSPGKLLYPNLSLTENTGEYITPISNGVKISTGNNNYSGNDYVAWCWKAGGSGTSNSNGTISSTVSANTEAGFSIVTYSGNNASSATIGHGLDSAPQLIWVKGRNVSAGWPTLFNDGSYSHYGIRLNESGVDTNNATVFFNNTAPTSTVFSVGSADEVNDGYNYVAYCFHSVDGYQKVGHYTGTGTQYQQVDLGFQARFIMVKKVSPSGDRWLMADTTRHAAANNDAFIDATTALSERDFNCTNGISFNSDNFVINTTDGSFNTNGGKYIYLAIA